MSQSNLRPAERRLMAMLEDGLPIDNIADRLAKSPAHVRRMIQWSRLPRAEASFRAPEALERRVVQLRADGESYEEIGRRFRRSGRFIQQVEAFAYLRHSEQTANPEHAHRLLTAASAEARSSATQPRLPHPDVTSKED